MMVYRTCQLAEPILLEDDQLGKFYNSVPSDLLASISSSIGLVVLEIPEVVFLPLRKGLGYQKLKEGVFK